jgi:hypothetical protein
MRYSLILLAACGSSTPPPNEQPDAKPDGTVEAHPLGPLMPQETAGDKTAVMATPTVVAIT